MTKRILIALTACLLATTGCNVIYKQNIQQGNALDQEDLDQLRLGMSQNQVAFLLGTPSIRDPFHHDRWDYVSSFSRRGGEPATRKVTLIFEDGALVEMDGVEDVVPVEEGVAGAALPDGTDEQPGTAESDEETAAAAAVAADQATDPLPEAEVEADIASPGAVAVVTAIDTPVATETGFAGTGEAAAAAEAPPLPATGSVPGEPTVQAESLAAEAPSPEPALNGELPGVWVIQLGAFEARENADRLVRLLGESEIEAGVITRADPGAGERYLVQHGPLASQAEAEALLMKIRADLGVEGFVVPPT